MPLPIPLLATCCCKLSCAALIDATAAVAADASRSLRLAVDFVVRQEHLSADLARLLAYIDARRDAGGVKGRTPAAWPGWTLQAVAQRLLAWGRMCGWPSLPVLG